MSEKIRSSNEQLDESELQKASHERAEALRLERERNAERSQENKVEDLSHEVDKALDRHEKERTEKDALTRQEKQRDTQPRNTKKTRVIAFNKQMKQIRSEMSPVGRTFSKFIHAKPVEKASEAIGSTVARPNAILAGSAAAFLLTAALYTWARYVGYPLSGFETIGAFILGWLVGIIIDFSRIMITGKS